MQHRKVSVVLGSGGARGITHIGVLKYLVEHNYEIDEVVGSSIGALIGAAFAEGKIEELGVWMSKLTKRDVFRLMDFADPRFGLLKGDRVLSTLQDVFENNKIEDLGIKYTAIATDLLNECEVVLREGSIYEAIRASIAIPGFFKAVALDHKFLVDGGVLNPLPINHVQNKDNLIIAVNLEGLPVLQDALDYNKLNSFGIVSESYRMMRRQLTKLHVEIYNPDYLIDIPHNISGIWDFDRASALIESGYELAKKALESPARKQTSTICSYTNGLQ